jgi:hypothetical protein
MKTYSKKSLDTYKKASALSAPICGGTCKGACCSGCGAPFISGYLHERYTKPQIAKLKKEYGFIEGTIGFNSPTGCRLPVEKRSPTCLGYFCSALQQVVPALKPIIFVSKHKTIRDQMNREVGI